ncbi:FAD-dependent oxidoreductase [Candidatus Hydrogenedentota bacterium]
MTEEHVQCIVVGAGPAGSATALTLAKSGIDVHILERGSVVGSKNVSGAILYSNTLNNLVPGFRSRAPLERNVVRQRYSLLTSDTELAMVDLHSDKFKERPVDNMFAVNRREFDQWFVEEAVAAGARCRTGTRVDKLLTDDKGRVTGVETQEDRLYAEVVILAEGANSTLAEKHGLRGRFAPNRMGLAVKETIALPREKIEDRFNLERDEGASFKYLGDPVQYSPGGAFILTNRESLSVGVVMRLSDLSSSGAKPYELLEAFKKHPRIRKLLDGGEPQEYAAHILPEIGYDHLPELVGDGVLLVGDAAGLLNVLFHEGINLAMSSGFMAGMTVTSAMNNGGFSKKALKPYRKMLQNDYVLKDMKMAMGFHKIMDENPEYFDKLLKNVVQFATSAASVTDKPKSEQLSQAWKDFKQTYGWGTLAKEAFKLWRLML